MNHILCARDGATHTFRYFTTIFGDSFSHVLQLNGSNVKSLAGCHQAGRWRIWDLTSSQHIFRAQHFTVTLYWVNEWMNARAWQKFIHISISGTLDLCYVFPTVSALLFPLCRRNSYPHFYESVATVFSTASNWVPIFLPCTQHLHVVSTELHSTPPVRHSEGVETCPQTKTQKLEPGCQSLQCQPPTCLLHLL